MLVDIMEPNFRFTDDRGTLVQLVREGYSQFNIIFSKQNVIRGNHYHRLNHEIFFVISGRIILTLEKNGIKEKYIFKKGDMFRIAPFIMHSFFYEEDTLLASMYDKGVELPNGEKDIYE